MADVSADCSVFGAGVGESAFGEPVFEVAAEFGCHSGDEGEFGAFFARHGGLWGVGCDDDFAGIAWASEDGADADECFAGVVEDIGSGVGDVSAGAQNAGGEVDRTWLDGADEGDVECDESAVCTDFLSHGAVSECCDGAAENRAALEPVGGDGGLVLVFGGFGEGVHEGGKVIHGIWSGMGNVVSNVILKAKIYALARSHNLVVRTNDSARVKLCIITL